MHMRLAFGKGLFESVFLVFLLFGLRCLGESDGSFERADSALSKCVSAFQKPLNPYDSVAYYDAEGYRRWCSTFTASEPKFGKDLQFKKKSTRMSEREITAACNEVGTCPYMLKNKHISQGSVVQTSCGETVLSNHMEFESRRTAILQRHGETSTKKYKEGRTSNRVETERAAFELARSGVSWLQYNDLRSAVLEAQPVASSHLDTLSAKYKSPNLKRKPGRDYTKAIKHNPLALMPSFYDFVMRHPGITRIVQQYLGNNARLDDAFLQRNFGYMNRTANEQKDAWKASALYHHDTVGHRLKLFVYFSDVGYDSATPVAEGTHRLLYKTGYVGARCQTCTDVTQDNSLSRFDTEFVEGTFNVTRMTGRVGDVFIFDTNAIHRAAAATGALRDRDVMVLEFSDQRLSHNIQANCNANAPTGPLNFSRKRPEGMCLSPDCNEKIGYRKWRVPRSFLFESEKSKPLLLNAETTMVPFDDIQS